MSRTIEYEVLKTIMTPREGYQPIKQNFRRRISGESNAEPVQPDSCKYAVVSLDADSDIVELFRVLTTAGFAKVTVLSDLIAHPDVDLKSISDTVRQLFNSIVEGSGNAKQKKRQLSPDFVNCKICAGKVAFSSKCMFNHVHQHAAIKQFGCPHCYFQDVELDGVRDHMSAYHPYSRREPVHNWSFQLHKIWSLLVDICFSDSLDQASNVVPEKETSQDEHEKENAIVDADQSTVDSRGSQVSVDVDDASPLKNRAALSATIHICNECGDALIVPDYAGDIPKDNRFVAHLSASHISDCVPYRCDDCGYCHMEKRSVIQHVFSRHPNLSDPQSIVLLATEPCPRLFVSKFFPFTFGFPTDSGELFVNDSPTNQSKSRHSLPVVTVPKELNETYPFKDRDAEEVDMKRVSLIAAVSRTARVPLSLPSSVVSPIQPPRELSVCTMCRKSVRAIRQNLLDHVKHHEERKRYQCPECDFKSHQRSYMRTHMRKHPLSQQRPIDTIDMDMSDSWKRLLLRCFPTKAKLVPLRR